MTPDPAAAGAGSAPPVEGDPDGSGSSLPGDRSGAIGDPDPPTNGGWRAFGSAAYFRLWMAQVVSSIGDWIGIVAILAVASRVSNQSEAAIALVMAARLLPGFFLAPVGGVLVDRWDRRKTMVACDAGRAMIVATIPFVDTLAGLFAASFLLEVLSLLWTPAKEASIPNLVPAHRLASANSLSLAAAYGTFPVGSALFAALAKVAVWLSAFGALSRLRVSQESVALWFDALTYVASGLLITTLPLPRRRAPAAKHRLGKETFAATLRELKEGLRFVRGNRLVRGVVFGTGAALAGCGGVVPLGPVHAEQVLGAGSAGFGLLMTGLGTGAAIGVIGLSATSGRGFPYEAIFVASVLGSGASLVLAVSVSTLAPAVVLTALLGLCAGSGYVSGFTALQQNVADEMRGRTFAALYTSTRFCLLLALAAAPIVAGTLAAAADGVLPGGALRLAGREIQITGTRLAMWAGGLATLGVGLIVSRDLRASHRSG
ncbi:MAG: MFS transporter [Acidimicrobiia bacterium]